MEGKGGLSQVPKWLPGFLRQEYFTECNEHTHSNAKSRATTDQSSTKKGDRNYYCVDCAEGPLCETGRQLEHSGHYVLQVRKASHTDAIRINDIAKLLDIAHIQTYTINGAKIVFLPSRPQAKPAKGAPRYCEMCHRSLQDQVKFCSLSCKLKAILAHQSDSSLTLTAGAHSKAGGYFFGGEDISMTMSDDTTGGVSDLVLRPSSPSPATPAKKRVRSSNKGLLSSSSAAMLQLEVDGPVLKILKLHREHAAGGMMMNGSSAGGGGDEHSLPHSSSSPTSVLLHRDHHHSRMLEASSPVSAGLESSSSGHHPDDSSLEIMMSFRKRARKGAACRAPGVGIVAIEGLYV